MVIFEDFIHKLKSKNYINPYKVLVKEIKSERPVQIVAKTRQSAKAKLFFFKSPRLITRTLKPFRLGIVKLWYWEINVLLTRLVALSAETSKENRRCGTTGHTLLPKHLVARTSENSLF